METGTALVLGQADGHHLEQAAFVLALDICVRLDLVVDDNAVRFRGDAIAVDERTRAIVQRSNLYNVHAGADRRTDVLLRDAVAAQDLQIARDRAAAVAAHRRDDKGSRAPFLELPTDSAHDFRVVGNAAAAHRHCDALAANEAGIVPPREFHLEMGRNVFNSVVCVELPYPHHARQRHFLQPLDRETDFRKIDHLHD